MAWPMLRASEVVHFSPSSELELPSGAGSDERFSTLPNEVCRALLPISRNGDALSESEEYAFTERGAGEPSKRLERAPIANRDELLRSTDAFGGDGIGEEPCASGADVGIDEEKGTGGSSTDELVGVPCMCSGVF
jgi:hypothetical protein